MGVLFGYVVKNNFGLYLKIRLIYFVKFGYLFFFKGEVVVSLFFYIVGLVVNIVEFGDI